MPKKFVFALAPAYPEWTLLDLSVPKLILGSERVLTRVVSEASTWCVNVDKIPDVRAFLETTANPVWAPMLFVEGGTVPQKIRFLDGRTRFAALYNEYGYDVLPFGVPTNQRGFFEKHFT